VIIIKNQFDDIFIHLGVKVQKPESLTEYTMKNNNDYAFDKDKRFLDYVTTVESDKKSSFFTVDDMDQWYFITCLKVNSLTELKLSRQVFIPHYLESNDYFPLIEELKKQKLIPVNQGYDKAYAHISVYSSDIRSISAITHSRYANADGPDDPIVIDKIHYISNIFNDLETRFIAGTETNSFATISQNRDYFFSLHLPHVGDLYLKYFIYFNEYGTVPSKQMMPLLLKNLWKSTKGSTSNFNTNLFKTASLEES
jgi:hypothetical protein